ncbi:MAG: hypothetical protein QNL05_03265 [Gammaproteobacteria bacterium]|nr:hypothetical protein [Gammaproteobacteria bacterium]
MEKSRWGLSVDIEGFSNLYEHDEDSKTKAIYGLRLLMEAIVNIGTKVYPGKHETNFSERLFAHQFGDGFVIISDFYEKGPERCIAIAISLMRHMLMNGYALKSAISTGDMSDIHGCYPPTVKDSKNNRVDLGMGLMTTIPVMGTALTKSYKLLNCKSGNILIIDSNRFEILPDVPRNEIYDGIYTIDWVSSELALAKEISLNACLEYGRKEDLLKRFEVYIQQKPIPPPKWVNATYLTWQH